MTYQQEANHQLRSAIKQATISDILGAIVLEKTKEERKYLKEWL